MANLVWRHKGKDAFSLLEAAFRTEEELEDLVFKTRQLLQDVFLLKRQVRGGRKPGIPDIVGVDREGNVCIVEIKNARVDPAILPQILQYALWAEGNPDSIKNLWSETSDQPEDVRLSPDSYQVRIIVIAPSFDRMTPSLASKINYPVDLIEVKRWQVSQEEFVLVNRLESEAPAKVRSVRGLPNYDRKFFEVRYNKESVRHFFQYIAETKHFVRRRGWPLEPKFTSTYCVFKLGFFNAFGIKWTGTRSLAFFFKIPKKDVQRLCKTRLRMTRYEDQWKEAVFNIEPSKTRVEALAPLFREAFARLTGKR